MDNLPTIADNVADALDLSPAQVTDLLNGAPLVARLPAEESSNGTTHKYSKETGAPVVGFRAENQGRDFSKDEDTIVTLDLKIMDYSWGADKAVAEAWRKGREAYIARKGLRHIRQSLFAYEQQIFYGTVHGSADGCLGLADNAGLNSTGDEMVVNVAGTTVGGASSVWLLRIGEDAMQAVYKGDGPMMELGETIVQDMIDGQGRHLPMYYTPGCTWLGLQIGGARDVARICNLTEENNKTLTDDFIATAIAKFPSAFQPNLIVMNRRSLNQLRDSRTATNATGAPAPFPTEAFGIEIVSTDAISNTETLLAA